LPSSPGATSLPSSPVIYAVTPPIGHPTDPTFCCSGVFIVMIGLGTKEGKNISEDTQKTTP